MLDSISTTGPCCGASIDSDINDRVTEYNNLPLFSITAPVLNIPHLTNTDVDRHMQTDQNFGYYTIHDFHSNSDIVECSTNHKAFSMRRGIGHYSELIINMLNSKYTWHILHTQ
jgi:hypothetical protein